jgi:hypothetical protein
MVAKDVILLAIVAFAAVFSAANPVFLRDNPAATEPAKPTQPKPTPAVVNYVNGTDPVIVSGLQNQTKSKYVPCYKTDDDTCTMGLFLSLDSSVNMIFIWNNHCRFSPIPKLE